MTKSKRQQVNHRGEPSPLKSFPLKKSVLAMSGLMAATWGGNMVMAQEASPPNDSQEVVQLEEIVVTGSLIRGIETTGAQQITMDFEAIEVSGAKTAMEVIGNLPQAGGVFNGRATLNPRAQDKITVNRPNLRSLPNFDQASGNATLVLIDGHRVVGMGIAQSSPDPDIVPPAVIERVEVITDGGSSLYGADAVGGVINIITKKGFDGVQIDAGYNTADDYWGYDTSITAGRSWDSGSAYVSFTYADRDSLRGKDRDWAREGVWTESGLLPNATECINPVGTTQTMEFRELVPGVRVWDGRAYTPTAVGERCDHSALATIFPKEERKHVLMGLSQELNDNVTLDVKAYYSERNTVFEGYPQGSTISFGPEQFSPTPSATVGERRERGSLGFSYGANPAYKHRNGETDLETWGVTPQLTVDMSNGWQLRSLLHFSQSDNHFFSPDANTTALLEAVDAGLLDPLNVAAADADVIRHITDWELAGEAKQELFTARFVADGSVIDLPAGELRMAAGFEFSEQRNKLRQGNVVIGGLDAMPFKEASRDVKSFFTEVHVPLLSGVPGAESLTLSASIRHDDYSDFGNTTNPTIGFVWEPVDWILVRGNMGESFVAPTLTDELNAEALFAVNPSSRGIVQPSADRIGVVIEDGRTGTVTLRGSQPNLKPQTADTWSFGFEISPPVVDGLRLSANYYEIEFFDLLGGINPQRADVAELYPDRYVWNPTLEQLQAAAAQAANGQDGLVGLVPETIAAIIDLRIGNTDEAILKGVDFAVNYQHDTRLGTFSYSLSGTKRTDFKLSQAGVMRDISLSSKPTGVASVGWRNGGWRTNLTVKYSPSSRADNALMGQRTIDSFTTVDLFVGYDFQASGLLEDLSLRFNVSNLFDEEPSVYRLNDQPSYRGFTLGRMFGVGLTKSFY